MKTKVKRQRLMNYNGVKLKDKTLLGTSGDSMLTAT